LRTLTQIRMTPSVRLTPKGERLSPGRSRVEARFTRDPAAPIYRDWFIDRLVDRQSRGRAVNDRLRPVAAAM
jgi:hypothetical protein